MFLGKKRLPGLYNEHWEFLDEKKSLSSSSLNSSVRVTIPGVVA